MGFKKHKHHIITVIIHYIVITHPLGREEPIAQCYTFFADLRPSGVQDEWHTAFIYHLSHRFVAVYIHRLILNHIFPLEVFTSIVL